MKVCQAFMTQTEPQIEQPWYTYIYWAGQKRIYTPYMTVNFSPANSTVCTPCIYRVGQNRIYTPYMTVRMVISLLEIPYVKRIYSQLCMVLANPTNTWFWPTLRIYLAGCVVSKYAVVTGLSSECWRWSQRYTLYVNNVALNADIDDVGH